MKKAIKVIALTLGSLAIIIGGIIYVLFLLLTPNQFNQEKWLNKPAERVNMVDSMLSEVRLRGKSKTEIIKLLGEEEEKVYFKELNNLVYYLGDERGFMSIDSEWLVIWFDDKDKVTDYEIKTD
ncbi:MULTISPECIES: hypothetical protein [unclassified Bacillus (in: firmicutes)]|uniref:hypothetical protein n=1 Tax=unclassified Bacillus (in: firmicutes) TaxID=185979 RepID=UPI0008EEBC63|nr:MULTISPECIES: hypothetical protein [unclassified Bacillus (in: firmicutes)]SFA99914.1 hypothetical protein SAMN02799634_103482 [Bacillus sp. UNCCL13]SFQ81864.1 hypothetical protein SAMN04488577_2114 [Bacillus sp. cl95]